MTVADIGAGTGLFLPDFDREVGSEGRVFAVEIAPKFLEHLRERTEREGLTRVEVVEGLEDSVELPAASVDLAFVCDTYHHFEYPQSTLASLYTAIRPGGSLVILDFERIPGESQDWVLGHMRAGKEVFRREIESAGFEFEREVTVEDLKENYVLRFRRP
jgi:ubiquinone/menaquinone biosynthesis C-methylase UbiE